MRPGLRAAMVSNALMLVAVVAVVVGFAAVFGDANAIVGVGVVVIALMLLGTDLSADPLGNGAALVAGMVGLGIAAFLATLGPVAAAVVTFGVAFAVCFLLVSDLEQPLYFPFLLTYAFMLFVAPVTPATVEALPARLLALAVGGLAAMVLQVAFNRSRAARLVPAQLAAAAAEIERAARRRAEGEVEDVTLAVGERVTAMSRALWRRRVRGMQRSLGGRATTEAAAALPRVAQLLARLDDRDLASLGGLGFLAELGDAFGALARLATADGAAGAVGAFRDRADALVARARESRTLTMRAALLVASVAAISEAMGTAMASAADGAASGPAADDRTAGFGLAGLVRAELRPGTLRFTFAMRMAILLSAVPLVAAVLQPFVPAFEYERWAAFTLLSVTQPVSDLTPARARKRLLGTLAGAAAFVVVFGLVDDPTIRMLLILVAGYLNSFQADYGRQVLFITFMALGAAAGPQVLGLDTLSLYRVGLVVLAAIIGTLASRYLFPYGVAAATRQLVERHRRLSARLVGDALARLTGRPDRLDDAAFATLVQAGSLVQGQILANATERDDGEPHRFVIRQRALVSEAARLRRTEPTDRDVADYGPASRRLEAYAGEVADGVAVAADGTRILETLAQRLAAEPRVIGVSLASVAQALVEETDPAGMRRAPDPSPA